jgi:hypothetical protein
MASTWTELDADNALNELEETLEPRGLRNQAQQETWPRKFALKVVAAGIAIGIALGGSIFVVRDQVIGNQLTVAGQTLGQVAMTEGQLREVVAKNKLTAYWSGPDANALYSLVANSNGQVFVRYLPDGQGLSDTAAKYRVIASYPQANAYSVTQAAGNQANAISFINADGAQVFYSKSYATNVYLAYPESSSEVEIFDPGNGVALGLATTSGKIIQIK